MPYPMTRRCEATGFSSSWHANLQLCRGSCSCTIVVVDTAVPAVLLHWNHSAIALVTRPSINAAADWMGCIR
jgi:hypothetical protein